MKPIKKQFLDAFSKIKIDKNIPLPIIHKNFLKKRKRNIEIIQRLKKLDFGDSFLISKLMNIQVLFSIAKANRIKLIRRQQTKDLFRVWKV